MDLSSLSNALCTTKDSPLNNFDDMHSSLHLPPTKKKELRMVGGNDEVSAIISAMKLTKCMKKPVNKRSDMIHWLEQTKERYTRYIDFTQDSKEEFPEICRNVHIINKLLNEGFQSFKNLVNFVYRTDKMIITSLKKFKCIV